MTKMEKELIEKLERTCQTEARVTLRLIRKLQKENTELKEENTILEGNKIGYKLAIQELKEENKELEKTIDLMATELSRRPLMIYLDNERDDRLVILDNPKEIIKYYTKKAEEENE